MIEIKKPSGSNIATLYKSSGLIDGYTQINGLLNNPLVLIPGIVDKTIIPTTWCFSFPDSNFISDDEFYLISSPTYNLNFVSSINALVCFRPIGAPIIIGGNIYSGFNDTTVSSTIPTEPNLNRGNNISLSQLSNGSSQWIGLIKWEIYYILSNI